MDMCFFPSKESIVADKILSLFSKNIQLNVILSFFYFGKGKKTQCTKKTFCNQLSKTRIGIENGWTHEVEGRGK